MTYFLISNKNEIVEYDFPDKFEINIYYLNENLCEIDIKRLDSFDGWGLILQIKLYDSELDDYFELITFGNSEENNKRLLFNTNIKLKYRMDNNLIIPKIIYPRDQTLLFNKYKLIRNNNNFIDFHIAIYYLDDYKLKIIVRRMDEECGWDENLKLILYDIRNKYRKEIINIGSSNDNFKIMVKDTKIKLEKISHSYEQKIPKIIVQTGYGNKFKNILHYNSVLTFIELNPEYTYIYFDDVNARKFLRENFSSDINYAYDLLVPGAFKADLLRYCFLYNNGGCYFDCKQILKVPLKDFLDSDKTFVICNDVIDHALLNAVIFSTAKNNIIEKTIKDCVYSIINKIGTTALDITGPVFFYRSIYDFINNDNLILKNNRPPNNFSDFNNDYYNNNITLVENNKVILNRFYKGYYNNYLDVNHYGKLYDCNEVYYKNFQNLNKCKLCVYPNIYNDKFLFYSNNLNVLSIKRTDSTDGWYFDLKIIIIDEFFKEYLITVGSSPDNIKDISIEIIF